MKLKPKAARRVLLLCLASVFAVVTVVALVFVRSWQNERRTSTLRAQGLAAFDRKDYPAAVEKLSSFLRRRPADAQAWLAFAESRREVEEPGARHIPMAVSALEHAHALDPGNAQTTLELARLYNTSGHYAEARNTAMLLRPAKIDEAKPDSLAALAEEASARIALKAFDQSLDEITKRMVELDPNSYRAAGTRAAYLLGAQRSDQALAEAASWASAHPGDNRFAFLNQATRLQAGAEKSPDQMIAALCDAAGLQRDTAVRIAQPRYTELDFATHVVMSFDALGMYPHSLQTLKDGADRLHDADFRKLAARREWELEPPADFVRDFPPPEDGSAEPSETLGLRALSLIDAHKPEQAADIVKQLEARPRDFAARGWSRALSAIIGQSSAKAALADLDQAIKDDPDEPIFEYLRAEVLWHLGRADEARAAWAGVYKSKLAQGWPAPSVRIADTLLDQNRLEEGVQAAIAAAQRARFSPSAALVLLRSQAMQIEAGKPVPDPRHALTQLDAAMARLQASDDPEFLMRARRMLLPARVMLLVASGDKDGARTQLEDAMKDPSLLSGDLRQRLAVVSAHADLGLESRLLAVPESDEASPEVAISRALVLQSEGKPDQAIALLDRLLDAAPPGRKPAMAVARAGFLDSISHPDATAFWKKISAEYPDSLAVQSAAIRSRSAPADPAFVEQIIGRLVKLGGNDPDRPSVDIRFARARAMLFGAPNAASLAEAIALLRGLVLESPSRLDLRDTLIDAMLADDRDQAVTPDVGGAIEQLTAAAALATDRSRYSLRLAGLYRQIGRTRDCVAQLSSVAVDTAADRRSRLEAIDRLAALRETQAALDGIGSIITDPASAEPTLLLRKASFLLALRRDQEAAAVYQSLAGRPLTEPDTIAVVAAALRSLGDRPGAERLLGRLDSPDVKPQERLTALASYELADQPQAALAHLVQATQAAPDDPRVWVILAQFHLSRQDFALAQEAARLGLTHVPDDPDLGVLLQQSVIAAQDDADLTPLADALARNPATAQRAEGIRAMALARKDGSLDKPEALIRLADRFNDDPSLQCFLARRLQGLTPPMDVAAARIMRRAAARFPADASVQQQAALTLLSAGQAEQAALAASAWSTLTRQPAAAITLAEAQLALGKPRLALEAVRDLRLPESITDSDAASLRLLALRVRANIAVAEPGVAMQLVQPYLASSAIVSRRIVLYAGGNLASTAQDVKTWISAASQHLDTASVADQAAVADAWIAAAERIPAARSGFLRNAVDVTGPFVPSAHSGPEFADLLTARARAFAMLGEPAQVEPLVRAAIAADPRSTARLLRSARLLLATNASDELAIELAKSAAAADPSSGSPLATLAAASGSLSASRLRAGDAGGGASARRDAIDALHRLAALRDSSAVDLAQGAGVAEEMDDRPLAVSLYERAIASPALSDMQSAILKNNLAFILLEAAQGSPSPDVLTRAKTLVSEAIEIHPLPDFYETLGSVNAASGDRDAAVAAYRRAVSIDAASIDAAVGLAQLLAPGTAAERAEARRLIDSVDAAVAAGNALSEFRKSQLEDTRQRLSK